MNTITQAKADILKLINLFGPDTKVKHAIWYNRVYTNLMKRGRT